MIPDSVSQPNQWGFIVSDVKQRSIEFRVWGRYALFSDPLTRVGGEKCSYHLPTYEALKGICKSIYWKPTFVWVIDEVRIIKPIRSQTKGTKPLNFGGVYASEKALQKTGEPANTLAIYTFLKDVEYQVRAHFEWNLHRPELAEDRLTIKHKLIADRMLARGGRQDIFLGTRDCQGYVEPCEFGTGAGAYDAGGELAYGYMFHGFDYPDETGEDFLHTRFWWPKMENGVVRFVAPEHCKDRKRIGSMPKKAFGLKQNLLPVETESLALELS
jgi:CRISPR-associated protein Cas5d